MFGYLYKKSFIASVALMATLQFYAVESYAKAPFVSKGVIKKSLTLNASRPMAGRNRRSIALRSMHNRYPRALNDQIIVPSRTNKLRINVLANDKGNRLKIKEVNGFSAKGGQVSLTGKHVVYLPKANFKGWDSFWYAVVDARGRRHSAKVNICICDR